MDDIIKTKKNPYLDYLRGISAIMVILFHYTARYDMLYGHVENYPLIIGRGSFAVLMFFLLSGYLTFRGINKYQAKSFIKNRFLRLYPTYFLCLIVTMPLVSFFLPDQAVSMKDFLLNFTMLQMYVGADFVDGAYWTLSCEVLFYGLIFIVLLFKGGKYRTQVIFAWLFIQIILFILPDNGLFLLVKKINRFMYFHCFMAGGVIAVLEDYRKEQGVKSISAILWVIALCAALIFFVSQQFIDHEVDSGIFMAISVVLIYLSVGLYNKLGGANYWVHMILSPLTWVASISYPLYLLHQNIGYIIINKMESAGLVNEIYLLVPLAIIITAAWLIHKYIELPFSIRGSKVDCRI